MASFKAGPACLNFLVFCTIGTLGAFALAITSSVSLLNTGSLTSPLGHLSTFIWRLFGGSHRGPGIHPTLNIARQKADEPVAEANRAEIALRDLNFNKPRRASRPLAELLFRPRAAAQGGQRLGSICIFWHRVNSCLFLDTRDSRPSRGERGLGTNFGYKVPRTLYCPEA